MRRLGRALAQVAYYPLATLIVLLWMVVLVPLILLAGLAHLLGLLNLPPPKPLN